MATSLFRFEPQHFLRLCQTNGIVRSTFVKHRFTFSTSTKSPSSKIYKSCASAIQASGLKSGDTLLSGGFGICGVPSGLIEAIRDIGRDKVNDLTVVSNNCGIDKWGNGLLLENKQIKRMVSSYVGENAVFAEQYLNGELEVEFVPQGTLAERLRAGGAGIPAFYTPSGFGTWIQDGRSPIKYKPKSEQSNEKGADNVLMRSDPKPTAKFSNKLNGFKAKDYVLEEAIIGDVAIVKANQCDEFGNCKWNGSSRNFNPECAAAGQFTIVECEEIVPLGYLKEEDIHLSGAFVDAIVQTNYPKKIERVTTTPRVSTGHALDFQNMDERQKKRYRIIKRAAQELSAGMVVNLGIGMPTLIPNFLSESVWLQSENGILGVGPYPLEGEEHPDLINAGKETVTMVPGASLFSSSESFAMIRGGHVDITILGAMEVSAAGDIANWIVPGAFVKGMGGAMDLVSCGSKVIATLEHCDKKGNSKIKKECELPLTGKQAVSKIITDLCVFEVDLEKRGLVLTELIDGVSLEEVKAATECEFEVSPQLKEVSVL